MNEKQFSQRLCTQLNRWGGEATRIENSAVPGTPDIFYCLRGISTWIETKILHGHFVYFEKFQVPWYRRHLHVGTRILIVIGAGTEVYTTNPGALFGLPHTVRKKWSVYDFRHIEKVRGIDQLYNLLVQNNSIL